MIRYLLDTNIASLVLRNRNANLAFRIQGVPPGDVAISTITEAEMRFGIALLPPAAKLHLVLSEFLNEIAILSWDSLCAKRYGVLAARQQQIGKKFNNVADAMIAAHALAYDLVLVSNDGAFEQIEGLRLQDWTKGPQPA